MTNDIRPGFVEAYRSPDEKTVISHRDGVPWYEAPIPPRRHKCQPQTEGWFNYFTLVWRCACGATARPPTRKDRLVYWIFVNERRGQEPKLRERIKKWLT